MSEQLVYLITDGEYSDYGVDSVHLTFDSAQRRAEEFFFREGRFPELEQWPLGRQKTEEEKQAGLVKAWVAIVDVTSEHDHGLTSRYGRPNQLLEPTPEQVVAYWVQGENERTKHYLQTCFTLYADSRSAAEEKAGRFRERVRELVAEKGVPLP